MLVQFLFKYMLTKAVSLSNYTETRCFKFTDKPHKRRVGSHMFHKLRQFVCFTLSGTLKHSTGFID